MTLLSVILLSSVITRQGLQTVRALLVKIVENKEAQTIPIHVITIFAIIIDIYLIYN